MNSSPDLPPISPEESQPPASTEPGFPDSDLELRVLYRIHVLWMFIGAVALIAGSMLSGISRLPFLGGIIFFAGLYIAYERLLLLNTIEQEFRRRGLLKNNTANPPD